MRSRRLIVLATVFVALAIGSSLAEDARLPPVKLDKNLRKALLKALADLDTESAEQKSLPRDVNFDETEITSSSNVSSSINNDQQSKPLEPIRGTIFSFDDFPNDDESPSEDKLQNSTFVELDNYATSEISKESTNHEKPQNENNEKENFQSHDIILPDKSSAIYEKNQESVYDQLTTRGVVSSLSSSTKNIIDNSKVSSNFAESLTSSSSNGIAQANALIEPSPTVSSPIAPEEKNNVTSIISSGSIEEESTKINKDEQEVKIFQAPLVAAFTVQQDERGVPKSVVPIYSPNGDGQALTLQEQLDFKQQLLERQLAELQAQQIQQTQFLIRQQQIYEQQLRQKQQQQLFIQEQSRLKQLQEEQSRLKQLEDQRNYQLQQQKVSQQFQSQQNSLLSLQPPFKTASVNIQPSLTLELPKTVQPASFQSNYHQQLRIQQLQRQQQLQQQQQQQAQLQQQQLLQQQRQQQLLQQQRLQQSFANFPIELQPPTSSPAQRFNRQEAFGNVGNFGFNENRQQQQNNNRNHFGFNNQLSRGPQTFGYNPYQSQQSQGQQSQGQQLQGQYLQGQQLQGQQHRQQRPQTPAKQIQHLLYQSGVAGDLGTVQAGNGGGQEDLNIVSKVLALNVGAVPTKNHRYNNFVNNA